jgi:predicted phosphodiesterase
MKIDPILWHYTLMLEKECKIKGESISRGKIIKALNVTDNIARFLNNLLDNKDLAFFKPSEIDEKGKNILVLADLHRPYQDDVALELALSYAERKGVDIILLLGDTIDFYEISCFLKKKKKKTALEEIEDVRKWLSELRKRFPKQEIIYYKGNHEERLENHIFRNAGNIADLLSDLLQNKLDFQKHNIEYKVDPFSIGKIWFMHGHEKPRGGNAEYITNVMWKYIHDHFVVGHFHRTQDKTFPHISKKKYYVGLAVGWLALQEVGDYNKLNNYNKGFAFIEYADNGYFKTKNFRIINGEIC